MRQVQQQQATTPTVVQNNAMLPTSRLPIALGIALGGALLVTLLTAGLILLINPAHLTGLLALLAHAPQLLLIPLITFILFVLLVLFGAMPLALYRYLHAVRAAQEQYKQLYTPLTALTNIRQTPDT